MKKARVVRLLSQEIERQDREIKALTENRNQHRKRVVEMMREIEDYRKTGIVIEADVEAVIHRTAVYRLGQCEHGFYQGGPNNGKEYRACAIFAEAVAAAVREGREQ